jgi:hypothetical protein
MARRAPQSARARITFCVRQRRYHAAPDISRLNPSTNDMTALSDSNPTNTVADRPADRDASERMRERILHHRAKRMERRDRLHGLSRKRARDEMPLRP